MRHVVMFSGGLGSWMAARRVRDQIGPDTPLTLLFTDTKMEDDDLYRFIVEAATDVDGDLEVIADGRTPWDVYRDERFIGNTKVDLRCICLDALAERPQSQWARLSFAPIAQDGVVSERLPEQLLLCLVIGIALRKCAQQESKVSLTRLAAEPPAVVVREPHLVQPGELDAGLVERCDVVISR